MTELVQMLPAMLGEMSKLAALPIRLQTGVRREQEKLGVHGSNFVCSRVLGYLNDKAMPNAVATSAPLKNVTRKNSFEFHELLHL
jgi:hypothetical protein